VILKRGTRIARIEDSKKFYTATREELAKEIKQNADGVLAFVEVEEINAINIWAGVQAMQRAIQGLQSGAKLGLQHGTGNMKDDLTFTVEEDKVGLGYCVVVQWPNGRRELVSGFGDRFQADHWIQIESQEWLLNFPQQIPGEQWINNRLPKAR
jgi:hypothetical protein